MKALLRSTTLATLIAVSSTLALRAEDSPAGYFDLGKFNPPSGGGQFVEVIIKSPLLSLAAKLARKKSKAKTAQTAQAEHGFFSFWQ